MSGYGQVYQTHPGHEGQRWRGILMNGEGAEVWYGEAEPTPDIAFTKMAKAAPKHKITDLRPWSGTYVAPAEE